MNNLWGLLDKTSFLILCFAFDDELSFKSLENYLTEYQKHNYLGDVLLIGCKSDVDNYKVKEDAVFEFARKNGLKYFTTSSKSNQGISELIDRIPKIIEQNLLLQKKKIIKKEEQGSSCLLQ